MPPGTRTEWRTLQKAAREENPNLSTPIKPEGAMTPPGTTKQWRTLHKTTEANKPSENHPSTESRATKKAVEA